MITVNGRFFAALAAILAGGAVCAIGAYAGVTQRLTGSEAIGGFVLLVIAAIAALWLGRHPSQGGQS